MSPLLYLSALFVFALVLLLHGSACRAMRWQGWGRKLCAAVEHDTDGSMSHFVYTQWPTRLLPGHPAPLMATLDGCLAFCRRGTRQTTSPSCL
jgi:hypothetical protein